MFDHSAFSGSLLLGSATAAMQMFEHHQPFAAAHLGQVRSSDHPAVL
ncbi:hypothetical protein [Zoogloea sp.]